MDVQQSLSSHVKAQGDDLTRGNVHVASMVFPSLFSALRSTSSSWLDIGLVKILS